MSKDDSFTKFVVGASGIVPPSREKIREGIHDIIGNCLIKIGCGGGCPKVERATLEAQETAIDEILKYLDSQGAAIKVNESWESLIDETS